MRMETKNELAEMARQAELDFGIRVRDTRKTRGMSQQELADAMTAAIGKPFHQTTIGRIENGTRPTSVAELVVLAALLDVMPTDLLADVERQVITVQVELRTREAQDAVRRLEEAQQRAAALGGHGQLGGTARPL
jgi:transcriptional regulator with XRE-family HTH domain